MSTFVDLTEEQYTIKEAVEDDVEKLHEPPRVSFGSFSRAFQRKRGSQFEEEETPSRRVELGEVGLSEEDWDEEALPEFALEELEGLRPRLAALLWDRRDLVDCTVGGGCFVRRLDEE